MTIAIKIEDLPTVYDAKGTEDEIYKFWEKGEYFKADASSQKPPYSIVIPSSNATVVLQMGHALDETLQDILVRYHRMSGFETLWLPGTDHAGIATQNVVEKKLREKGLSPLVVKGISCRRLWKNPDARPSGDEDLLIRPEWLGEEVSMDRRYFNSSLIRHPFKDWK